MATTVRRTDVALAAVVAVMGVVEILLTDEPAAHNGIPVIVSLVVAGAVLVRTTHPIACLAVPTVLTAGTYIEGSGLVLTGSLVLATLLALAAVARHTRDRRGRAVGAAMVLTLVLGVAILGRPWDTVFFLICLAAAWSVGTRLRHEAERSEELTQLAIELVEEQEKRAQAAVTAERARLARELHDTVAHTVSVMTLQVGGVRRLLEVAGDRERERDLLLEVEALGRQSVAELHRLLTVLRSSQDQDAETEDFTRPSVADLPQLVARIRAAGVPVALEVRGVGADLEPGLDLTVYRAVQEALTNVIKHGAGAATRVRLLFTVDALDLLVEDDGPDRPGKGFPSEEPGVGLIGLRERVTLYGGQVETGPRPGGGFRVAVHLPLRRVQVS